MLTSSYLTKKIAVQRTIDLFCRAVSKSGCSSQRETKNCFLSGNFAYLLGKWKTRTIAGRNSLPTSVYRLINSKSSSLDCNFRSKVECCCSKMAEMIAEVCLHHLAFKFSCCKQGGILRMINICMDCSQMVHHGSHKNLTRGSAVRLKRSKEPRPEPPSLGLLEASWATELSSLRR